MPRGNKRKYPDLRACLAALDVTETWFVPQQSLPKCRTSAFCYRIKGQMGKTFRTFRMTLKGRRGILFVRVD